MLAQKQIHSGFASRTAERSQENTNTSQCNFIFHIEDAIRLSKAGGGVVTKFWNGMQSHKFDAMLVMGALQTLQNLVLVPALCLHRKFVESCPGWSLSKEGGWPRSCEGLDWLGRSTLLYPNDQHGNWKR